MVVTSNGNCILRSGRAHYLQPGNHQSMTAHWNGEKTVLNPCVPSKIYNLPCKNSQCLNILAVMIKYFIRYLFNLFFRLLLFASAAVAYPLRRLMCCVFRDALLHTTLVICGYLCYCHLPVSFDQSAPSPLTSLNNKVLLPTELLLTGCFLFFAPFSANTRDCCAWKSQEISSFWDTQTTLSGTKNYSSPFWHLVWTTV